MLNESILNHLFLPCHLPDSAEGDYLICDNHRNEYKLLESMKEFFKTLNGKFFRSIFPILISCFERWENLQDSNKLSAVNLQKTIDQLVPGDFLPLYFHHQNAAILIEIESNNGAERILISSWQVLLSTKNITSSLLPHFSCFPVPIFQLRDRSQLRSIANCELLIDLMNHTLENSQILRRSYSFDETRDIPSSHYVTGWWISHFSDIQSEQQSVSPFSFNKKHRDQIRWKDALLPFRRSGLWMTIKTVLQSILTKRLGRSGMIIYKLLITFFLTHIIYTRQKLTNCPTLNIDLLMHCSRKIVRRLNKLDHLRFTIEDKNIYVWTQNVTEEIKYRLGLIVPNSTFQISIQRSERSTQRLSKTFVHLDRLEMYRHSCENLKACLNTKSFSVSKPQFSINHRQHDSILVNGQFDEELPSTIILANISTNTIEIALAVVEIWIETCLNRWMDRLSLSENGGIHFKKLLDLFETYQQKALEHYYSANQPSDCLGYTRFILSSLTILHRMHQKLCTDPRFERLSYHSINIPNLLELFEYLILPNREEMIRVRQLYDYFQEFSQKSCPDLLSNIDDNDAFGIHFASQSVEIERTLQEIRSEVERDRQAKREEYYTHKQRYDQLKAEANELQCQCEDVYDEPTNSFLYKRTRRFLYRRKCKRCKLIEEADNIRMDIYECPIPENKQSALAVVFELQMPVEIRCYREILWQFINRPCPKPSHSQMYEWLHTRPHASKLTKFNTGPPNCKVKLVSSIKSLTETHYSNGRPIGSTPLEQFLHPNHLTVKINPTRPTTLKDECRILTAQLEHPNYKLLQFAIDNTKFEQNRVIAESVRCPLGLKPVEFVEFGSFRSGHCLQWWNLLSALELDSLSFDEDSVLLLITHSLIQYGPMTVQTNQLIHPWCTLSHQQLFDDHFLDELIMRLDRRLDDCQSNWQNELTLLLITIVTIRILTICNSKKTEQVIELALKCRQIGESSIEKISQIFQTTTSINVDEMQKLRNKVVTIASACLFTFSIHLGYRPLSNPSIVALLKAATSMHDNGILNKKSVPGSIFMRNLMRWRNRILVKIQPAIGRYLKENSYQSLHQFSSIHWGLIKAKQITNGQWKKRHTSNFDGWYDGQYESIKISIDFLRGEFLINGMSIGFLPNEITSNELFHRTFDHHIFEVQPGGQSNAYVTKHAYHHNQIHYEFHFNQQRLIIRAIYRTGEIFQLIPHKSFQKEFAVEFVDNYSHWNNEQTNTIQFRPINFQDPQFLSNIPYELNLTDGFLITKNMTMPQVLINRSSSFFQDLYKQYFSRLDIESYVYMFRDNAYPIIRTKRMPPDCLIHIHLSRLGLAFKYDDMKKQIFSREYSDMYINENQCFGTLIGLNAGLLLSPIGAGNRKLLVPFGQIQAKKTSNNSRQIVSIERTAKMSFDRQYFVFSLNDRLHLLQSSDSPTGWLYLALLHAMTSGSLSDYYTGMTGMERAFQLLYSAGCWTDQPLDSLSLNIAYQIANISPKVEYYPTHLACMETIKWNEQSLPYSHQHFGYYLIIKKLIEASERLSFMYSSTDSKTNALPRNNEKLLAKLYWDYRDSYNPTARLSDEMEANIFDNYSPYSYESAPVFNSVVVDNRVYRPLEDFYKSGNLDFQDPSTLHCFPLNQWINGNNHFKNIFIGLLKLIDCAKTSTTNNQSDQIDRLEILFDFLHYISEKRSIKPFYLNMMKAILKDDSISFNSIVFPPFGSYKNIEQIQVHRESIQLYWTSDENKRTQILNEVEESFRQNLSYTDKLKLIDNGHSKDWIINQINDLFKSWRSNRKLRDFVQCTEQIMNSVKSYVLINRIRIDRQKFTSESNDQHHRIQFRSTKISIDPILLLNAREKYCCHYSDGLFHSKLSTRIPQEKRLFPEEIFPSTNNEENSLSNIANFFKQQLAKSWEQFQSEDVFQQVYPSVEQVKQLLHSTCEESAHLWNELIRSIRTNNELLFDTGLALRMTPSILVSLLHQIWLNEEEQKHNRSFDSVKRLKVERVTDALLTPEQCILLGSILVNWVIEQQLQRTIHCADERRSEDFEKEVSNIPHVNWIPSEHVPWLILELEMNITIREVQVDVARHMIDPSRSNGKDNQTKSIVMQMNMGEGKTSVIVPMLALSLCSSTSSLVRIIVLKSLLIMNYQSLRSKLGGLLNRRIFPFVCRRDMKFDPSRIEQIFQRVEQGLNRRDIILTAPEYILSFELLTIDKCRRMEFEMSRPMLNIQRWFKKYVRDILDESDEILHVKYQLIYTIGNRTVVDAGTQRWKTIQSILELVKKNAEDIAQNYNKDVFYEKLSQLSHFPSFRLLSHEPFPKLAEKIASDWLDEQSYRQEERQLLLSFILKTDESIEYVNNHQFSQEILQRLLIVRGLLSSEVLFVALTKRYRVNFGVNPNPKFDRLMAVPFRAKDVAVDNTEFGHPDIAIVLTQLFYYYDGLNDDQLLKCFERLRDSEKHPEEIYHEWISYENADHLAPSIKTWEGINLKDDQQRRIHLFPIFRKNMLVINYFLNHFVFPQEAKQFPQKLISSAWDLSSDHRSKIITGFSGTNDTQLLLPIHIDQCDLSKFVKTDAIVLNNLLQPENEFYRSLSVSVRIEEILERIINNQQSIQVILDVGALFINGSNRQIAVQWLEKSNRGQIDYAVYFESDSLYVCDRQNQHCHFATSPASERLEHCIFYLDEVHTRGTDFKFPNGFRAVVTLGNGLTKDRFVQACMRMRKLGKGHSLTFFSSHEVDQRIRMLRKKSHEQEHIKLTDILRWVYENTQQATWNGLHEWAAQSLSFQRKIVAFQNIQWTNEQQQFTEQMMKQLPLDCVESEVLELCQLYGMPKSMQKIAEIHRSRCYHSNIRLSSEINPAVLNRLESYGGSKTLLAHSFDEEQEREFEREIEQEVEEERQQERPTPPVPHEPTFHKEIERLANSQGPMMNLAQFPSVFFPLHEAFHNTTFFSHCKPSNWRENLWISKEFQCVIRTQREWLDAFLRPPRWVIIYRNEHIIFLSPYEANRLISSLQHSSLTSLRLLLPRMKRHQSILVNTPTLSIPSSVFTIPNDCLAQLFLFNGTLYFNDAEEQRAYCHFLGICPMPRAQDEQEAFEKGWIDNDGFIVKSEHRHYLRMDQCGFESNPLALVRKILENRRRSHVPGRSHVGAIILHAKKLLS